MTSLGPRSAETEKRKEQWEHDRNEVDAAVGRLKGRLETPGRVGRALRIGRLGKTAGAAPRQLWRAQATIAGRPGAQRSAAARDLDLMSLREEVDRTISSCVGQTRASVIRGILSAAVAARSRGKSHRDLRHSSPAVFPASAKRGPVVYRSCRRQAPRTAKRGSGRLGSPKLPAEPKGLTGAS
jgi:hypothetical protein